MPILSSISGAAAKAYGFMSNALRLITDNFNRANGSLGTTNTGQSWSATRGTWSISSNQATSSDSASTYPMATVDINAQNVIVSADITNGGPGVAFWVTDANSWWASSVDYNSTSTTTSYTYPGCCGGQVNDVPSNTVCCGGGSPSLSAPITYYYGQSTSTSTICVCNEGESLVGTNCCYNYYDGEEYHYICNPAYCYTVTNTVCDTNVLVSYNAGCGFGSYSYYYCPSSSGTCTGYTTVYTYYTTLKLYSSVSGTVAVQSSLQIASSNSAYQVADSIQAQTNNNDITVKAYLGGSQLGGTLSYTASSPTKGLKAGIIKTSSTENAGSVLDNFSAQA